MSVHQCPRCELRFRGKWEVAAHLVDDHHVDPEEVERYRRLPDTAARTGRAAPEAQPPRP